MSVTLVPSTKMAMAAATRVALNMVRVDVAHGLVATRPATTAGLGPCRIAPPPAGKQPCAPGENGDWLLSPRLGIATISDAARRCAYRVWNESCLGELR